MTGTGDLDVGIMEAHGCKGECNGDQGEEEEKKEEGKGLLPGTAADSSGLQDPHLVFRPPSLAHPDLHFNTVFQMHHLQKCLMCSSF